MNTKPLAIAIALLAVTACGTAAPSVTKPAAAGSASTPPGSSPVPAPAPTLLDGNIELAPSSLPKGPFTITPLWCGRLTASQQNEFGTNATAGFVYRYANHSPVVTGAPNVSVNFLDGAAVTGTNVTGDLVSIPPGQSAEAEVDAASAGGGSITFGRCEVMGYGVVASDGDLPGSFAP